MSKRQVQIETLTLITLQGSEVEIEYPLNILDEFLEDMRESFERQDLWNVGNWCNAVARFKGARLEHVDMAKIIGMC